MRAGKMMTMAAVLGLVGAILATPAAAQAAPAKKPPVMGHPAEGKVDCLSCHKGQNKDAKPAPADHATRPNESCQLCHAKEATMQTKDAPPMKHTLTGKTNCLMCHSGKMAKVPAPAPATHVGITDNKFCAYCHLPAAPATP